MKRLALVWWLCACSSHAEHREQAAQAQKPGQRIQVTYDLDLDIAIDDKARSVQADLEAMLADKKMAATVRLAADPPGALIVTPAEASDKQWLDDLVKDTYGDTIERWACAAPGSPNAICIKISAAYAEAVKKAALANAVTSIRERLVAAKVADPGVEAKGGQIVVQFPAADPQGAAIRSLISRSGKLEMKVVDDGSDYMRRLAAHVGMARSGEATDPRAITDAITAEIEQWREEESGAMHGDFYLVAHDSTVSGRTVIERYLADLSAQDPSFRVPDDRQIGYEHAEPGTGAKDPRPYWRTYYLERAVRLSGASISNAIGSYDPNTNRPVVTLEFNRRGAVVFGDLTAQIVGKKLATLLDGKITSAPIIMGPIRGGHAVITMGGGDAARQEAERDELVNVLKTGSLPSPLREVSSSVVP